MDNGVLGERIGPRLVVFVFVGWMGVALVAGAADYWAFRTDRAGGSGFLVFYPPFLAGAIWSVLTVLTIGLADRVPLRLTNRSSVAVHLGAALALPFVLNAAYSLVTYYAVGDGFPGFETWRRDSARAGLRWLHVNAGAYLAVVLLRGAYRGRVVSASAQSPSAVEGPMDEVRLPVRSGTSLTYINAADISWIEGAGDYVRVSAGGREHLVDERLRDLEALLADRGFHRVHRSAIVNFECVRELDRRTQADWVVVLQGGKRINVSRGRRAAVRAAWTATSGKSRPSHP